MSNTYLAKYLGLVEHFEGRSPSYITVQWNLQRLRNSAANLGALEVLDALSRCLDLWGIVMYVDVNFMNKSHSYLDCQSPDSGDNVQGAT